MNPYSLTLIIVGVIIIVAILIIVLFPKLHNSMHEKVDKTTEEIAKDEVKSIVINPEQEKSKLQEEIQKQKDITYIEKMEKELGFIFLEDDIEALLVQMEQDRKDRLR